MKQAWGPSEHGRRGTAPAAHREAGRAGAVAAPTAPMRGVPGKRCASGLPHAEVSEP